MGLVRGSETINVQTFCCRRVTVFEMQYWQLDFRINSADHDGEIKPSKSSPISCN